MERKLMNSDKTQWKESELKTVISEVGGGATNIQSKLTFYTKLQIVIED